MLTAILFFAVPPTLLTTALLLQIDGSEFQDLGKIMLGGFVLAVGAGVTFTVVRLRLRDKKAPTAQFISIKPRTEKEK
jgi:hypothetical protein